MWDACGPSVAANWGAEDPRLVRQMNLHTLLFSSCIYGGDLGRVISLSREAVATKILSWLPQPLKRVLRKGQYPFSRDLTLNQCSRIMCV